MVVGDKTSYKEHFKKKKNRSIQIRHTINGDLIDISIIFIGGFPGFHSVHCWFCQSKSCGWILQRILQISGGT